jgi:hypothetical protein
MARAQMTNIATYNSLIRSNVQGTENETKLKYLTLPQLLVPSGVVRSLKANTHSCPALDFAPPSSLAKHQQFHPRLSSRNVLGVGVYNLP